MQDDGARSELRGAGGAGRDREKQKETETEREKDRGYILKVGLTEVSFPFF